VKRITIGIRKDTGAALKEMGERFVRTWKTGRAAGDSLQFESTSSLLRSGTATVGSIVT
jgi:hypothetical protein